MNQGQCACCELLTAGKCNAHKITSAPVYCHYRDRTILTVGIFWTVQYITHDNISLIPNPRVITLSHLRPSFQWAAIHFWQQFSLGHQVTNWKVKDDFILTWPESSAAARHLHSPNLNQPPSHLFSRRVDEGNWGVHTFFSFLVFLD